MSATPQITAITIIPYLDASTGGVVDDEKLGLSIFPGDPPRREDDILQHQILIHKIFQCRTHVYMRIRHYESHDAFLEGEQEFEKRYIPMRLCILANQFISYGQSLTYDHTECYTFLFTYGESAANIDGYYIFQNGKHVGYQSKEARPSVLSDAPAAFDRDWFRALSAASQSNKKLLSALDWFCKSFRKNADTRDQMMALSITLEGILDAKRSTSIAERRMRSVIQSTMKSATDTVIKQVKLVGGVLSESITKNLLIRVRCATGSKSLAKFITDFYGKGSSIRHGDAVFDDDLAWYGEDSHLRSCEFIAQLCIFLLDEIVVSRTDDRAARRGSLLKRWEVVRLENRLTSDKQRIDQIAQVIRSKVTVAEKFKALRPYKDFLRDRSAPRERRAEIAILTQTFFREVAASTPEYFSNCNEALIQFLSIVPSTTDRVAGQKCYELRHKLLESNEYREGQLVLIELVKYCAWLYGWH